MDARITKQRLGNMLSYDWLKIIGAVLAAAVVIFVLFTMIATRATAGQKFDVFTYGGVAAGEDFPYLQDDLKNKNVFSYDVLSVGAEAITNDKRYGSSVFMARRTAGEGRVLFLCDYHAADKDGNALASPFDEMVESALAGDTKETERQTMFLDPEAFLAETQTYLVSFFGEGLAAEEPDADKTREAFMNRNQKDKRFRTAAKKEEGVRQERERLIKLKEDYLFVSASFSTLLSYADYTSELGNEFRAGIRLGALPKLYRLVNYTVSEGEAEKVTAQEMVLCFFNNKDKEGDLKYESVNFLAYLVRTYGGE